MYLVQHHAGFYHFVLVDDAAWINLAHIDLPGFWKNEAVASRPSVSSRNFGQHHALTAGIDNARRVPGTSSSDCDLFDRLRISCRAHLGGWRGHDVAVVALPGEKEGHSGSYATQFVAVLRAIPPLLSGVKHDWSTGNFLHLFRQQMADGFCSMRERLRFVPASCSRRRRSRPLRR